MIYLLDTNPASAVMDGRPRELAHVVAHRPPDEIAISAVTRGEIEHGIERLPPSRRRAKIREQADKLWELARCLPVDEAVADEYARIKAELERIGRPVGKDNDLWIAATATANGCVLVSAQKSFTHVAGLAVEDWSAEAAPPPSPTAS